MRRLHLPSNDRSGSVAMLLLAVLVSICPAAFPRGTAEKVKLADQYYDEAEQALADLQDVPAQKRTAKDYLKVIHAYHRVYQTSPLSAQNAKSLLAIGELYQVMGHNYAKEKYFTSAVEAYEFLLQQYPHSKYQADALLAEARIYQSDLKQTDEARKRFDLLFKKYPNSTQAKDARSAPPEEKAEEKSEPLPQKAVASRSAN